MNITLNNTPYRYNQYNNQRKINFTANPSVTAIEVAGDVGEKLASNSSRFFDKFTKIFDNTSEWLCRKVAKPVLGSKPFGWFAEKVQNADNLYQHCLTTGSVITSGLYMQRTMTNKNLDKDRRNTLGVNQFLTLCVSTAGAYLLDGYLKNWWENISARYVGHKVSDNNFAKDFKDVNNVIKSINKALKRNPEADLNTLVAQAKEAHNMTDAGVEYLTNLVNKATKNGTEKIKSLKLVKLDKFIDKLVANNRIPKVTEKLGKQIKGMGYLRSMIVFGFVYRYLVPVAVTKPANKLCDMYLEHKKAKQAEKAQRA